MRILLAHNSLYYPSHGGGDISNRLLMEALAERGHEIRVVARIARFGEEAHGLHVAALASRGVEFQVAGREVRMRRNGVDARTLTLDSHWRDVFSGNVREFDPDVILASTDDPAQLLLDIALGAARARVVYLVRATIGVPFGPDSSSASAQRAAALRQCDGVVGVSEYVARYMREWGGVDAIHLPISPMPPGEYLNLGAFENPFVTMVNPCGVKGIAVFVGLADTMPSVRFAAVPGWGTNAADLSALRLRTNITILEPVDEIDDLLRRTRVLLVPSLWAEARSRIVIEAMAGGVPVIASDIGGIPEAKLGIPYLLPINPITRYKPAVDENMAPVAEVPEQNLGPWRDTLELVLSDRERYDQLSKASRDAALQYARGLSVEPFEQFLEKVAVAPKRAAAAQPGLSPDKQKLLALRLRERAWLPYLDPKAGGPRLFCFPYAGCGALAYRAWISALAPAVSVCPVRLQPCENMAAAIAILEAVIAPHLRQPFAFYGHSMGATIAFELARSLRRGGRPLPSALYVSGSRAPQFRLNWTPPPEPTDDELLEQLRRLNDKPDVGSLAWPALRADTALYRNYVYTPGEPLPIPIFAYTGRSDPNVSPEQAAGWEEQTSARFALREFEGGHFFIQSAWDGFRRALLEDLV